MNSLSEALEEYLSLRRGLGFKLAQHERLLGQFISFLKAQGAAVITTELTLRWATERPDVHPTYWAQRLRAARLFAQYRSATDPQTEVPPTGLLPHRYFRKSPHIYSEEEIGRVVKSAGLLESETGLRSSTYATLFGLLAVTGLRVGEAVALDRDAVNLGRGVITVHLTKFRKSRLVPVHESTTASLAGYATARDTFLPRLLTPAFFVSEEGARLTTWRVQETFRQLSRTIGLRGPNDRRGPRLHDFRYVVPMLCGVLMEPRIMGASTPVVACT
jgi:integrase/recombinase XerD